MTTILILLALTILTSLLAGMRLAVVLRQGREQRRGGYLIPPAADTELVKWQPW